MNEANGSRNTIVIVPEESIGLYNAKTFQNSIDEMILQGYVDITLDFKNVKSIDCAAIGMLFKAQRLLKEQQGRLKVVNVSSKHIQNLFSLIKLNKVIPIA